MICSWWEPFGWQRVSSSNRNHFLIITSCQEPLASTTATPGCLPLVQAAPTTITSSTSGSSSSSPFRCELHNSFSSPYSPYYSYLWTYYLYSPVPNVFDAYRSITRANGGRGLGPGNRDIFGPWNGNEQSKCHLGTKKSRFPGPNHPLPLAKVMDLPGSKHYVQNHINSNGCLLLKGPNFTL